MNMQRRSHFESLPAREGFPFNYERAQPDRNALFALNEVFGRAPVAAVRTKYHRARLTFSDLLQDLMEYDVDRPPRQHQPSYFAALESVRRDIGIPARSIVPLTTGAVAKHPSVPLSKSPGLPYKQRGYATKGEALADPATLRHIRQLWYDIEANKPVELPDVACYARAQICPREKNKVRATWGYPLDVYIAEAQWFYPYLDVLKNQENPIIAYGVEIATGGMSFINRMATAYPGHPYLLGDWSKFDKTIPPWLIRDAFRIVEETIDFSQVEDVEGKRWNVRDFRSKRRWRRMVNYFINTPVRMSDGRRFLKKGGVPSGSCWTNVIDSIVNAIVMRYLVYEATGSFPCADCYLGDDSVIVLPGLVNITDLANMAKQEFGMLLNPEKTSQTRDERGIHFLGYYNLSGHPTKALDTIIASTVYPERTVLSKVDTIARLVGQAYSCFDTESATGFLRCAHILLKEENLSPEAIEDYIHANPSRFKYLQTIGIAPQSITIPVIDDLHPTWRTLPSAPRRMWRPRYYDPGALYNAGVFWYGAFDTCQVSEEDFDSLSLDSGVVV
uniref:RdRp n=1 Tax=Hubei partiti-like virus 5 TaxID=1923058 RepID=A0A1L3KLK8_9VIRU|nr:RdRp [Hubei partiti-like virus 5]